MRKSLVTLLLALGMCVQAEEIKIGAYVSNYSGGEWMYALTSEDGHWLVTYYIQIEKDKLENGTIYHAAQLRDSYANYLSNPQNPSAQPTTHMFDDCTFSMTVDEANKTGVIEAMFVSHKDGQTYQVRYSGKIVEPVVPPTPPTPQPVETSMDDDETVLDLNTTLPAVLAMPYTQPMLTEIELRCYNAQTSQEVSIVFVDSLSRFDEVTYAPVGVYQINSSHEVGTVYAGQGHTMDNSTCVGTYAATMENGLLTARWYVVSGTVTVENHDGKLYMHMLGQNSQGRQVDVTIGEPQPQGLRYDRSTIVQPRKQIREGHVVIVTENEEYTILGTKTK